MKSILKTTEHMIWKRGYPLSVSTIGLMEHQHPIVRPHGLPIYQVFYGTSGEGELTIGEETYRIESGSGFFLQPNVPHSYYGISKDWQVSYLGFQGNICESLLESCGLTTSGAFQVAADTEFLKELTEIYEYIEKYGERNAKELSKMCYACLLELFEHMDWIDVGKMSVTDETIEKIISYLQKEFYRAITLDELSSVTGWSKEYMCSYFKKKMHKTIMQVLCDIRIMNACVMLNCFPEKKVAEISKQCGFESPSYFGSVFRKHQGMTPDTYRKRIPQKEV